MAPEEPNVYRFRGPHCLALQRSAMYLEELRRNYPFRSAGSEEPYRLEESINIRSLRD